MAVLSDQDRADVAAEGMRDPNLGSLQGMLKADWRAAVNGIDDYLNTNAAAINSAIPQPARANLTVTQKALLLMYVITKRYLSGV